MLCFCSCRLLGILKIFPVLLRGLNKDTPPEQGKGTWQTLLIHSCAFYFFLHLMTHFPTILFLASFSSAATCCVTLVPYLLFLRHPKPCGHVNLCTRTLQLQNVLLQFAVSLTGSVVPAGTPRSACCRVNSISPQTSGRLA